MNNIDAAQPNIHVCTSRAHVTCRRTSRKSDIAFLDFEDKPGKTCLPLPSVMKTMTSAVGTANDQAF